MRKFFLGLLLLSTSFSFAQSFRLGVFGGVSNYHGDLEYKAYGKFTRAAFGITGNYEVSSRVNVRAGITLAKVAGDDKYNVESVRIRNLNFKSNISEFSLLGEFNVFNLANIRWTPYAFAGLALFHFDPYTSDSAGVKTFLKPLSTEGQSIAGYDAKQYSLTQLSIPFGGGVKYSINDNIRIGVEVGMRKLFTDYLDDVSTSYADPNDLLTAKGQKSVDLSYRGDEIPNGNPTYPQKGAQRGGAKQDWYYFSGLHLTFQLNGGGSKRGGYGCPSAPL